MADVRDRFVPGLAPLLATAATLDVRPGDRVDSLRDGMKNRVSDIAQADRLRRRSRREDLQFGLVDDHRPGSWRNRLSFTIRFFAANRTEAR